MTIHRLSAGSGFRYLLCHTSCEDVQRTAVKPLISNYAAHSYRAGRWTGTALAGSRVGSASPLLQRWSQTGSSPDATNAAYARTPGLFATGTCGRSHQPTATARGRYPQQRHPTTHGVAPETIRLPAGYVRPSGQGVDLAAAARAV